MQAEQRAMLEFWPESRPRAVDLACGSAAFAITGGRRRAILKVVALDFGVPMSASSAAARVCGSMIRAVPSATSPSTSCVGLGLGSRNSVHCVDGVSRQGSDRRYACCYLRFYPERLEQVLPRSFKDQKRSLRWTVPHHCYDLDSPARGAAAAHLNHRVGPRDTRGFALSGEVSAIGCLLSSRSRFCHRVWLSSAQ